MNTAPHGNNVFEIQSEILTEQELATITGYQIPSCQKRWLIANGWQHVMTGSGRPVVGRLYARLKLAGVKPSATNATSEAWSLDLSRVS